MGRKSGGKHGTPKTPEATPSFGRAVLMAAMKKIEEKLKKDEYNPTLSDFIRLVQLEKEMAEDEPLREIRVSWSGLTKESETER